MRNINNLLNDLIFIDNVIYVIYLFYFYLLIYIKSLLCLFYTFLFKLFNDNWFFNDVLYNFLLDNHLFDLFCDYFLFKTLLILDVVRYLYYFFNWSSYNLLHWSLYYFINVNLIDPLYDFCLYLWILYILLIDLLDDLSIFNNGIRIFSNISLIYF